MKELSFYRITCLLKKTELHISEGYNLKIVLEEYIKN